MSTYLEIIAKAFGRTDALQALEVLVRATERDANICAEQFTVTARETGIPGTRAATYKSGLSSYWPALESLLGSSDLDHLDVCIYAVYFHECYAVHSECRYKGVMLAEDGDTESDSDDAAYRAFVSHVAQFGTHPSKWRACSDQPDVAGLPVG